MRTCRRATCHAPSDCCGAAVYIARLAHGTDVPEGWERIEHRASHHSKYDNFIQFSGEDEMGAAS